MSRRRQWAPQLSQRMLSTRHILLTIAVYNPEAWTLERNQARLELFRHITVPSLVAQTTKKWEWRILLHPDDPLAELRVAEAGKVGVPVKPVLWQYDDPVDQNIFTQLMDGGNHWDLKGEHLTTRVDDDDGFFPDAFERIRYARGGVVVFQNGIYFSKEGYTEMWHPRIAFGSVYGRDEYCATSFSHLDIFSQGPVSRLVEPGWIRYVHEDSCTIRRGNPHRLRGRTWQPLTPEIRGRVPIHWDEMERIWQQE